MCVDAALLRGCVARKGCTEARGRTPEAQIRRESQACILNWDPRRRVINVTDELRV